MEIKDRIRKHRIKQNMNQSQLAAAMGYKSDSIVSMWESGERTPPLNKFVLLSEVLGVSYDELLGKNGTETA